jgi:hypothetical protein
MALAPYEGCGTNRQSQQFGGAPAHATDPDPDGDQDTECADEPVGRRVSPREGAA